ncbi:hypothetical protein Aduo_016034 [Ancylostoma duodenale]
MSDERNLGLLLRKKIREAYTAAKKKVPEMSVKRDRLHIGVELIIKPSIAAIKPDADLSDWEGTPVRELLTEEERRQYDKGEIEFGSIKLPSGVTLSNPTSNGKEGKTSNETNPGTSTEGLHMHKRKRSHGSQDTTDGANKQPRVS